MPHLALPRASLFPLDNLLGAWLLGVIFSAVLFGVTCLQIFLYFTKYGTRDSAFLRIFVIFLFALDTVHLALVSHSIYRTVVTNFGDYVALRKAPWTLWQSLHFMLSTVFNWNSSKRPAASWYDMNSLYKYAASKLYLTSGLSFIAAGDLLISCTMIYLLFRSKTGFKRTNKAINTLVAYTVSSGAITTVFTIGDVIAGSVWPSTLIQIPFMSILNSRDHIRQQLFAPGHAMVAIPSYQANSSFPPDGELAIATELKTDRGPSK
ncbi:hypothetical protein R3P38DRAFT_3117647 [Favolaschia claudopus]|uniref:DUF6534 domain-containing protein n=1 Tax=Favolaschia claudopus TaxID=2862362 RepID=A0AAV9ZED7_9AGAR